MKKILFYLTFFLGGIYVQAQSHSAIPLGAFEPDREVARDINPTPQARTTKVSIPNLKAVLITGDVDGAYGESTQEYIKWTKETAAVFRANGVSVTEFYCPNNDWNKIKQAANGAQFLVYQGHGILLSDNPFEVGGFWLKDDVIRPEKIRSELKLAPNALIFMGGVCYAAGTSASDGNKDIGMKEAQKRVSMYAKPFMDNGAAGYVANNWHGGLAKVVSSLFSGEKLGEAYTDAYGDNPTQTNYNAMNLWVTKTNKSYLNAFVGKSDKSLPDLFSGAKTTNLPNLNPTPTNTSSTSTTVSNDNTVTNSGSSSTPKEYFMTSTYTFMNMTTQKAMEVPTSTFSAGSGTSIIGASAMTGGSNQKWKLLPAPNQTGQFAFLVTMNNVRYALKADGSTLTAVKYNAFKDVQDQAGIRFTVQRAPESFGGWLLITEDNYCLKMQGSQVILVPYRENSIDAMQCWDIVIL